MTAYGAVGYLTTMNADELIAANQPPDHHPISDGGLAQVKKLVDHNDTCIPRRRVSAKRTVAMLREFYGWEGRTKLDLDKLCRHNLGRAGWGTP